MRGLGGNLRHTGIQKVAKVATVSSLFGTQPIRAFPHKTLSVCMLCLRFLPSVNVSGLFQTVSPLSIISLSVVAAAVVSFRMFLTAAAVAQVVSSTELVSW